MSQFKFHAKREMSFAKVLYCASIQKILPAKLQIDRAETYTQVNISTNHSSRSYEIDCRWTCGLPRHL